MDAILTVLEGISNFFGFFGEISGFVSTNWNFGKTVADFLDWLLRFVAPWFGIEV